MKWLAVVFVFAASPALADAPKDTVVSGAVVHGDVKLPRDEKTRMPPVKDEPATSKSYPLAPLPSSKLK